MSAIATILLIPAEGSGLLDDPYAPTMWQGWGRVDPWQRCSPSLAQALVLATDGKPQRHGCLCLADSCGALFTSTCLFVGDAIAGRPEFLRMSQAEHYPGARLVFLDASGADITAEVTP